MVKNDELRESGIHGDASFPLCVCTITSAYIPCHWHEDIELIYLPEGSAVFQVDTNSIELNAGQLIFINSGELHSGGPPENSNMVYYAIVFNPYMLVGSIPDSYEIKFIDSLVQNKCKLPRLVSGAADWEKKVLQEVSEIVNSFNEGPPAFKFAIKSCLYRILSLIIASNSLQKDIKDMTHLNQYYIDQLKKVLMFVHNNYHRKITVQALANEINMSQYHFCRFFKSLTGQTPIDYINHYRVNQASILLQNDNCKIADIAAEVGFENLSHFNNTFKKYIKYTPSEFRRCAGTAFHP